jgi:hypothetical protein
MDFVQAAVTSGIVLVVHAATYLRKSGRDERRMDNLETDVKETKDSHAIRLDGMDKRFDELNTRFVPRHELEETMGAIRESQKRTERWLEALMLPRVRPLGSDSDDHGKN